jgi:predicted hotdog family 3-hydroxylacyl-ACP dehydratase
MLGPQDIAALIPHRDAMCLLDRVLEWDADHAVLAARSHRFADNPLRSGGRLRALHLCEYGAQAMAVHGGLAARARGSRAQPGLLVSLREVTLHRQYLDDLTGELTIDVRRLWATASAWQYAFTATHGEELVGEGRAAIIAGAVRT